MKNIFLSSILFLALLLTACTKADNNTNPVLVKEMDAQTVLSIAKATQNEYVIIDVRSPSEYKQGHVPAAINLPHNSILKDISLLDPYINKELIFYCHSGRRAKLVTDVLVADAYKGIHHLSGDMGAWEANRLPMER